MVYDYKSEKHKESSRRAVERFRKNKRERWLEITRKAVRVWMKKHPDVVHYNVAQRSVKKRNIPGKFTLKDWELLKEKYHNACPRCGKKETKKLKLSIDHIIPISKGGTNEISNIQPLCKKCNCIKHNKIIKYEPNQSKRNSRERCSCFK